MSSTAWVFETMDGSTLVLPDDVERLNRHSWDAVYGRPLFGGRPVPLVLALSQLHASGGLLLRPHGLLTVAAGSRGSLCDLLDACRQDSRLPTDPPPPPPPRPRQGDALPEPYRCA